MAEVINISERAVEKQIAKLKEMESLKGLALVKETSGNYLKAFWVLNI